MPYIVTKAEPHKIGFTLLDLLQGRANMSAIKPITKFEDTLTRTFCYNTISPEILRQFNLDEYTDRLEKLYARYRHLNTYGDKSYNYKLQVELISKYRREFGGDKEKIREAVKVELESKGLKLLKHYDTFWIPKSNGKWRQIDNPSDELKTCLTEFKLLLEEMMGGWTYHTSAFAYVPKRCTKDAVMKHANNKSNWFLKLDFSNFFGSTTFDFLWKMMSDIFPFSEIVKDECGKFAFRKCLQLCFLDGGLPQGTPSSPTLTNIMMIAIDHKLSNALSKHKVSSKNGNEFGFIYTRYADDLLISNRVNFNPKEIEDYVIKVLDYYGAPFSINKSKTRYGSSAGANWNLGLMLNENHKVTVGHRRKKRLESALTHYVMDRQNNRGWSINDIEHLEGEISYCKSIEKECIERIIEEYSNKFNLDIVRAMKVDKQPFAY